MERAPGKLAGSAYGMLCRAALRDGREHPEITFRTDYWLALIARRLAFVARALMSHEPTPEQARELLGEALPPLTTEWVDECVQFVLGDAESVPVEEGDDGDAWD